VLQVCCNCVAACCCVLGSPQRLALALLLHCVAVFSSVLQVCCKSVASVLQVCCSADSLVQFVASVL